MPEIYDEKTDINVQPHKHPIVERKLCEECGAPLIDEGEVDYCPNCEVEFERIPMRTPPELRGKISDLMKMRDGCTTSMHRETYHMLTGQIDILYWVLNEEAP